MADHLASPKGLRFWLVAVTLTAVLCAALAAVFGLLINMDTKIEMNPAGDPAVRQAALGFRIFAWTGISLYAALLTAGIIGGWLSFRRRRYRTSLALSLLAAIPTLVVAGVFIIFATRA